MIPSPPCLRVALYARVSSKQQAAAGTIASQVEALQQRIQGDAQRCAPEQCYLDDGYSGDTLLRPALERLRDQAAAGVLDRVYIHNPDRLSRKYAYQVVLLDEFLRAGVEVVFLNQSRSDSPEDVLLLQVQGIIAEFERTKIMERSRRGRTHAARQGCVSVLSQAPYGYRYVDKHTGGGQARYEVIGEQARVVRQIFAWVTQERCSLREVCRRLQQQGIGSPKGHPRWSAKSVATLLSNPAYRGQAGYGKTRLGQRRPRLRPARGQAEQPRRPRSIYRTEGESIAIAVPALVDEATFAAAAEQLQENRRRQRQRQPSNRYLLAGLTVCQQCGYAYFGMSPGGGRRGPKRYSYYRCGGGNASRYGGQRLCHNAQVRGDLLEAAVWQDVCALLRHPEKVEEEYQRRLTQSREGGGQEEEAQAQARQRTLRRGLERLIDAYTEGLLSKEEFEPRIKTMRDRLKMLEEESRHAHEEQRQQQELRLFIGCLEEFGGRVQAGLDEADAALKREICRRLIKRIEIDEEDVHVVYRVGLPPFEGSPTRGFSQHCGGRQPAVRSTAGLRRAARLCSHAPSRSVRCPYAKACLNRERGLLRCSRLSTPVVPQGGACRPGASCCASAAWPWAVWRARTSGWDRSALPGNVAERAVSRPTNRSSCYFCKVGRRKSKRSIPNSTFPRTFAAARERCARVSPACGLVGTSRSWRPAPTALRSCGRTAAAKAATSSMSP